jgi:hypothetical protein
MWRHLIALPWMAKIVGLISMAGLAVCGWLKRPATVPKKIRVLNHFRGIFPEWTLQRQARVIAHAFDSELAEAKAKRDWEALHAISGNCADEVAEYSDALDELRSNRLVKKALKRGIPTDHLQWETGNYGNRYLTRESQTNLRRAVIEESRKDWEFKLKILTALPTHAAVSSSGKA